MIALLKSGGFLMLPIFACALAVTFIIFERFFFFRSCRKKDATFLKNLYVTLDDRDTERAKAFCKVAGTPLAQMAKKALDMRLYGDAELQEELDIEFRKIEPLIFRFVPALSAAASISTLLGLLGTVVGNIGAFAAIGEGGAVLSHALIASAISKALVTTAAGLVVAIPATLFHGIFSAMAKSEVVRIESAVTDIKIKFSGRTKLQ